MKGLQRKTTLAGTLALGIVVASGLLLGSNRVQSQNESDASLLEASHRENGKFFNPWRRDPKTFWDIVNWQLFSPNPYDKNRQPDIPTVENDGAYLKEKADRASVTWVGHATFVVHDGDDVFLTDPHFTNRALLPRRIVPPGLPIEAIPEDAFAVVSHNHYDHLDKGSIQKLPNTVSWFVPLGVADWVRGLGPRNVVELDWWQSAQYGRWKITCLPSQHWSNRLGQPANSTLWCSWLIESKDRKYFFAGDTGYFPGFAEFGRRFGPIDIAMLPIGAYEPRWVMSYQHLDPSEAYQAFKDLGARYFLPMHWGTFDLTDEPMDLPPKELKQKIQERGGDLSRVHVFAIGERWQVPD
jgi:N-acyl-phosphatidylethanolamine-hydrolysing phospholipase D